MVSLEYVDEGIEKLLSFINQIHTQSLHILYEFKQRQIYGLTAGVLILILCCGAHWQSNNYHNCKVMMTTSDISICLQQP